MSGKTVRKALNEVDAILLLFEKLATAAVRPLRVLDLYLYLKLALKPGALSPDMTKLVRDYTPSMLFLVLELLRAEELLNADGSAFLLTEKGRDVVEQLQAAFPDAIREDLHEAALAVT